MSYPDGPMRASRVRGGWDVFQDIKATMHSGSSKFRDARLVLEKRTEGSLSSSRIEFRWKQLIRGSADQPIPYAGEVVTMDHSSGNVLIEHADLPNWLDTYDLICQYCQKLGFRETEREGWWPPERLLKGQKS